MNRDKAMFAENKQQRWPNEVKDIVQNARAIAKYRGQDANRIFILKMNLANAVARYDSKPNS